MDQQKNDYQYKWAIFIAVGMGIFLSTIDGSIVNVSLPTLVRELNTDFATIQWVTLAYLLTITTLMLSAGRLADIIGKKPVFVTGYIIFTIGSLLCGLSNSAYTLIAARVFQGIGASMNMALGMAIITESFPPRQRGMALGSAGAIVSIGIVLGPTMGGLILNALTWHWIFFVNLPVGIIGVLMVLRFVPNIKPIGKQKFDYMGAGTLFLSLLSFLFALTLGQSLGFFSIIPLSLIASFLVFLAIFIRTELHSNEPMIDLRLFKNDLFSTNLGTGFITFVSISGSIILMPFYLENILGHNTATIGLLMATVPIGMGIMAPISGSLSDRFGSRPITVAGLAILVVGYIAISTLGENTTILGYVLRYIPIGIGMGIFQSPNNSAIMGTAPKERLGIVSGMLAITRTLGQTTGIAILGAIWASRVYAHAGKVLPGGVTTADPTSQVVGLNQTFSIVIILIVIALLIGTWTLVKERRAKQHGLETNSLN
ncbi:MAG: MFS transporter [Anaerolineaceae bacterium]|nr:MFS transporter [Anaerolineaceae bacterium]